MIFAGYSVFLVPLLFCRGTPGTMDFNNRSSLSGKANNKIKADKPIDTGKTYEVFFRLREREECIKIVVSSFTIDDIQENEVGIKTFFIVEKAVDMSRFRNMEKKELYLEIGRNYDTAWERERDVLICSSGSDPIRQLGKGLYRIRFTTFYEEGFDYEVDIFSENRVEIKEKPGLQDWQFN